MDLWEEEKRQWSVTLERRAKTLFECEETKQIMNLMGLPTCEFQIGRANKEDAPELARLKVKEYNLNPLGRHLLIKGEDLNHLISMFTAQFEMFIKSGFVLVIRHLETGSWKIVSFVSGCDLCVGALQLLDDDEEWDFGFRKVLLDKARGGESMSLHDTAMASILSCADKQELVDEYVPKYYGKYMYSGNGATRTDWQRHNLMFLLAFFLFCLLGSVNVAHCAGFAAIRAHGWLLVGADVKSEMDGEEYAEACSQIVDPHDKKDIWVGYISLDFRKEVNPIPFGDWWLLGDRQSLIHAFSMFVAKARRIAADRGWAVSKL